MSLIEVMVAVFILASGLLGLGALQSRSLAMNQSAHNRSIAADLAADLADRIRANRTPFLGVDEAGGSLVTAPPNFANCPQNTSAPDTAPVCASPSYLVATEMAEWNQALRSQLPDGCYEWDLPPKAGVVPGVLRYRLTIFWSPDRDLGIVSNAPCPEKNAVSTFVTVIE